MGRGLYAGPIWGAWEPAHAVSDDYTRAVAQLELGELDLAEVGFRQVLANDPECGAAQHGLGVSLLRQNRSSESVAVLERAASAYPKKLPVHVALSVAHFANQSFDKAESSARRALGLDPGSVEALGR